MKQVLLSILFILSAEAAMAKECIHIPGTNDCPEWPATKTIELHQDSIVSGIPLKKGKISIIIKTGRVLSGTLSSSHMLDGVIYPKNTKFRFGMLSSGGYSNQPIISSLGKDTMIHGILLKQGTGFDIMKWKSVVELKGTLAQKTIIENMTLAENTKVKIVTKKQTKFIHGFVKSGTLGEASYIPNVEKILLPKGSSFYRTNKKSTYVSVDLDANSIDVKGHHLSGNIRFQNGKLASFWAKKNYVYATVPIAKGATVRIYADGILKSVSKIIPSEVQGFPVKTDYWHPLIFSQSGELSHFLTATDIVLTGIEIKQNTYIHLDQDKIKKLEFSGTLVVRDIPFYDYVEFYSDGNVKEGLINESVNIAGLPIGNAGKCSTLIRFYPNQQIKSACLGEDFVLQGFIGKGGKRIEFYEDGSLKSIYLAEQAFYKGERYPAGTQLRL